MKLEEVDESSEKLGKRVGKNNWPEPAIENTQNELAIGNTQPGVLDDTSSEDTSTNMQTAKNFFGVHTKINRQQGAPLSNSNYGIDFIFG